MPLCIPQRRRPVSPCVLCLLVCNLAGSKALVYIGHAATAALEGRRDGFNRSGRCGVARPAGLCSARRPSGVRPGSGILSRLVKLHRRLSIVDRRFVTRAPGKSKLLPPSPSCLSASPSPTILYCTSAPPACFFPTTDRKAFSPGCQNSRRPNAENAAPSECMSATAMLARPKMELLRAQLAPGGIVTITALGAWTA